MKKNLAGIALAGLAVSLLAGCASGYSPTTHLPYLFRYLRSTIPTPFALDRFSYVDREGQLQPLDFCTSDFLLQQQQCATEGGTVVFSFRTWKGRIKDPAIQVEGRIYEMNCSLNADETWSTLEICMPEGAGVVLDR